jgi:murein DD-endopeptidase MepM/ murein hydrolase activator NlpD
VNRRRRRRTAVAGWALAGLVVAAPVVAEPAPALADLVARWRAVEDVDPALRAVLSRLAERTAPPASTAAGRAWPALGAERLPAAAGESALRLRVPAAAAVRAPAAGRVVFADRMAGLGLVLITAHGDEYHSVLAGLDAVDVGIGTRVAAGERIGRMAERIENGLELHLELRHHGRPVDPLPWLGVATGGDGPS